MDDIKGKLGFFGADEDTGLSNKAGILAVFDGLSGQHFGADLSLGAKPSNPAL